MPADDEILAALHAIDGTRRSDASQDGPTDYRIADISPRQGAVDVALVQRNGNRARLLLQLPSSGEPQYWLYAPPADAADWVQQLLTWIDEEVFTDGMGASRAWSQLNGESYLLVENYGWRVADAARHAELSTAAGALGWYGDTR